MKLKRVQAVDVNALVFMSYAGMAAAALSLLVLIYTPVIWSWWGTFGAAIWLSSQSLAFVAVQLIGAALGPSIWSGTTILTSFVWGVTLFGEDPRSLPLSLLGMFVLAVGIAGIGASNSKLPARIFYCWATPSLDDKETERPLLDSSDPSEWSANASLNKDPAPETGRASTVLLGVLAGVMMGLINGSLMLPFNWFIDDVKEASEDGTISVNVRTEYIWVCF